MKEIIILQARVKVGMTAVELYQLTIPAPWLFNYEGSPLLGIGGMVTITNRAFFRYVYEIACGSSLARDWGPSLN